VDIVVSTTGTAPFAQNPDILTLLPRPGATPDAAKEIYTEQFFSLPALVRSIAVC
jgi:hypothetical protein